MNILKPILALLLIGCSHAVFSQKDAPVVGDAIKLVNLLNKDYATVAPDQRAEQIIRDRAEAIRIFKGYLPASTSASKQGLFSTDDSENTAKNKANEAQKKVDASYVVYAKLKKAADVQSAPESNEIGFKPNAAGSIAVNLSPLEQSLAEYRKQLFSLDTIHFVQLKAVFSENPYLKHIVTQFHSKHSDLYANALDVHANQALSLNIQKGLPFIGGDLSFTTAIDGLSRFLASRIKEELTTYVIDNVKEWLENPSDESPLNELKVILPRTTNYLLQFRADQMLNFGDEMKQYIEEDLNNLLTNLPNLRNTPRFERLLEMHPDMDFAFEALELVPKLAKMNRPIDYFEILENSRTLRGWNNSDNALKQNVLNAVDLTCMIARSLTTLENGQLEIVNFEEINHYLENTEFYLLYYGMLHQQNIKYYNVTFTTSVKKDLEVRTISDTGTTSQNYTADKATLVKIPLSAMMKEVMLVFDSTKLDELERAKRMFESMLSELGLIGDRVNTTAMEIKKLNKKGEKIPFELAHEFVAGIIDFSDEAALAGDSLVNFLLKELLELKKVINVITIDTRNEEPVYTVSFGPTKDTVPVQFPLYEKVSPYISTARAVNDIVLDVHNENYVTALLKALEIAAKVLPDNVLVQVTDAVQDVSSLKNKINGDDLAFLVSVRSGEVKKGTSYKKVKKDFESQAIKLNQALVKWMFYFRGNYPTNAQLERDVSAVKEVLTKIISGNTSDLQTSDIEAFKTLAANETFKKLIVAYYSNQKLDELSDDLRKELEQFKITIKGKETHLFTDAEAKNFQELFDKYVMGTINWVLAAEDDKKGEAEKLKNLLGDLELFVANYAFAFPSKLAIDPNSQVFKLIHFVNDMAKATDATDVEKAIEAFALPSGSYAIKRTAKWNASINSYPGILLGPEFTRLDGKVQGSMAASLTVPVGLSLSRGSENCGSIGLFVPVIDIGAFTRMHLDSSANTSVLPEINFSNIFSPGLYVSYGFRNSPISINLGGQYGPDLRRIEANGEVKSYESWRLGVGFVLDIPLFNLYTKPRLDFK